MKKTKKLLVLIVVVLMMPLNLYSCNNITVADFTPNDINNIMAFLFTGDDEYYVSDYNNNYDNGYEREVAAENEYLGYLPVANPVTAIVPSSEPDAAASDISDTQIESDIPHAEDEVTPEPQQDAAEEPSPPPVEQPAQQPTPTQQQAQQVSPQRTSALVRTYTLFPEVPEAFERVAFPSNLRMTDATKRNIRSLEPFTARSFRGTTAYIMTTNPLLFTPELGGGYLSDMRNYRTRLVETATGARIGVVPAEMQNLSVEIEQQLNAGVHLADILSVPLSVQSRLAEKGLLTNLRRVPFINLSAPHYNQSAITAGTINGNLYSIISDALFDPSTIYAMFFNRDLITRHNLPNPAELHINGTWTYDNMFELGRKLTASIADLDMEADTTNHFLCFDRESNAIINGLFTSAGDNFTFFNAHTHDYPTLSFNNSQARSFIDSIARLFVPSELHNFGYYTDNHSQREIFTQGNTLFSIATLDTISAIAEVGFDWGILPAPMTEDGGRSAVSSFVSADSLAFSVLRDSPNTEVSGYITEALAVASHQMLQETYIREQLMYTLRDIHSARVLSDIVGNVVYSQYNMYGTIDAFHNATVGLIREAAAQHRIIPRDETETFDALVTNLHEYARGRLNSFFSISQPFMRN